MNRLKNEGKFEFGIRQIVNCMKVMPNEKVVIITDIKLNDIAGFIKTEISKITGSIKYFVMEDFGPRPLKMPDEIMRVIKEADIGFRLTDPTPGELPIFIQPIYEWVARSRFRLASMPNITRGMIEEGMNADYDELKEFTAGVYKVLNAAKRVEVYTALGTELEVSVGKYKWIPCDGNIIAGHWSNLPDGEVFTAPENVNGKLVVDGVLGDYFDFKYGAIYQTPVSIEIKNNFAVKSALKCANKEIERDLREYIFGENLPNSARVGEFALGTNRSIRKVIGNMLQDEKIPGVHLAFGDPIGEETGCPFKCASHCDMVVLKPTVIVDGVKLMDEGRYLI